MERKGGGGARNHSTLWQKNGQDLVCHTNVQDGERQIMPMFPGLVTGSIRETKKGRQGVSSATRDADLR